MLKFSANLSMMFTETEDAIGRMEPAAEAGFEGVEYLFVYDMDLDRMKGEAERLGLGWSVVNIAVGEGVKPGPLVAAAPGKEAAFRENLAAAKKYCAALKPQGAVVPAYTPPDGVSKEQGMAPFISNMRIAAEEMAEIGVPVIIEALNPDIRPNSLLTTTAEVRAVVDEVDHPNLGIEYDAYHMYSTEGNMAAHVEANLALIGNIQIADVPGRAEPGTGDIDYDGFLGALDAMGYDKYVALEYTPSGDTVETLAWMDKWR